MAITKKARDLGFQDRIIGQDGRGRKPQFMSDQFDYEGRRISVYVVTIVKGERVAVYYGPDENVEVK